MQVFNTEWSLIGEEIDIRMMKFGLRSNERHGGAIEDL